MVFFTPSLFTVSKFLEMFVNLVTMKLQEDLQNNTKADDFKLHVLQYRVVRMIAGANHDISTESVLSSTNSFSVHQLTACITILSVKKCIYHQKPEYFADKFKLRSSSEDNMLLQRQVKCLSVKADLTITRGGYCYRSSSIVKPITSRAENFDEGK